MQNGRDERGTGRTICGPWTCVRAARLCKLDTHDDRVHKVTVPAGVATT